MIFLYTKIIDIGPDLCELFEKIFTEVRFVTSHKYMTHILSGSKSYRYTTNKSLILCVVYINLYTFHIISGIMRKITFCVLNYDHLVMFVNIIPNGKSSCKWTGVGPNSQRHDRRTNSKLYGVYSTLWPSETNVPGRQPKQYRAMNDDNLESTITLYCYSINAENPNPHKNLGMPNNTL